MVITENGVERELEDFEVQALAAAHRAHMEAELAEQWDQQRAMEAFIRVAVNELPVPAEDAVHMVALHPVWEAGASYPKGFRVREDTEVWNSALWECLEEHTSQEGWEPGSAPSLWAKVLPGQSEAEAGEWEQPDSTNPYMKGDRMTYEGKLWYSTIDNNVWAPGVYGWVEVE